MSIDLEQLLPSFIEESLENVEEMEEGILKLDLKETNLETVNQIFRAVHTIKGNSAIFKFSAIGDLAKNLENLLDNIRKQSLELQQSHVDILLKSSDCLRKMLLEIKETGNTAGQTSKELITDLLALNNPEEKTELKEKITEKTGENIGWLIQYTPIRDTLMRGNQPENLFSALQALGKLEIVCDVSRCPELSKLNSTECYLSWKLSMLAHVPENIIRDILAWATDESEISLEAVKPKILETTPVITSIRVATEKIDNLMNTVEELVITESVLKEIIKKLGSKTLRKFSDNLDDLEQHSRRLQEVILRMRMVPIAFAINRFPRMVLDISKQLGKEIEFKISGEQTEIDKTMVEKITDPLLHLIRNAIDHGIELPEIREKNNKKRMGVLELSAYQSGNNIIIDIKDDGAGLNAKKIRASAIDKKIISKDQVLTEAEYYQLIFQPGFSTTEKVTDLSGRGVGLDVVMQNIHELGGKVEVISTENKGATFRLRLPLTLAIMDCQLIKVGSGFYAIPLSMILEMCELDESNITLESDGCTNYTWREEVFKLINLADFLLQDAEMSKSEKRFLIKLKVDQKIVGFSCDALLFQQQVVIKSIEENYSKVPGILGATVLGDGELALILDVKEIIQFASDFVLIARKTIEPAASLLVETALIQGSAEYLCFLIENKEYAFNMENIKEIAVWQKHAFLPFSPAFVKGIMNLRGKMIPIVDSRILFGFNPSEYSFNNVIIVVETFAKNTKNYIGVVVDSVTETNVIRNTDLEVFKNITIANIKGKKITLLGTDRLVTFPEQKWGIA